jgi:hypothetical protein
MIEININAENNKILHVCTLSHLPYIDIHIPKKDFERWYFKLEFGQFYGLTLGYFVDGKIKVWKRFRLVTKGWII